jgi:hypothetical protein
MLTGYAVGLRSLTKSGGGMHDGSSEERLRTKEGRSNAARKKPNESLAVLIPPERPLHIKPAHRTDAIDSTMDA